MRRFYWIGSAVGVALALGAMAVLSSCIFVFDIDDCSQYLSPHCFDGGGTDGGDSGPPPSCIPSLNDKPVAASCGIFVSSESGDDTNGKGTPAAPYKTVGKALQGGTTIYVCAGAASYSEALAVDKPVTLFGALDCATWAYNATTKTQLTAPADAVPLTLTSSASGSAVEDFAITAKDATADGGSSIAVIADGVAASFTRTDITAGNGTNGAPGTTPTDSVGPTDPKDPAIKGNDGKAACMDPSVQLGGAPVDNPQCASTGGLGGAGAISNGSNGDVNPATPQTALGGVGQPNTDPGNTWSCASGNGGGTTGANGSLGKPGAGVQSTDLGTIDKSGYIGVAGKPGGLGMPGQGGGGGGGAKGKTSCAGASGGGGGAGGCGGNGGTGGKSGGASIGLVSLGATLTFEGVTINVGTGGKGGDGGEGEVGGIGGKGGSGGVGSGTLAACDGGNGGQGGQGGKGGGGRGGHAVGIAYTGATAPATKGVTFIKGTPGDGGKGDSGNMGDGANGVGADVQGF